MNIDELVQLRDKLNQRRLMKACLTMPKPEHLPGYHVRIETPFGPCEWNPTKDPTHIIIYPTIQQVERLSRGLLLVRETLLPIAEL